MRHDRRRALRQILGLGLAGLAARPASAQEGSLFPLADDKGRQVYNYRLPSDLSTEGLPGIVWTGALAPEPIVIEFFDYNCGYCHAAAADLDALLLHDPGLRLGLVNNPILAPGSVQAAKVQQAVLRSHGPATAYAFHKRIFSGHGPVDGPSALQAASGLGLDAKAIETAANLDQVGAVVRRQAHLAEALGFQATPSFMINGVGVLGYPGPRTMARIVDSVKRCDTVACG